MLPNYTPSGTDPAISKRHPFLTGLAKRGKSEGRIMATKTGEESKMNGPIILNPARQPQVLIAAFFAHDSKSVRGVSHVEVVFEPRC